MGGCQRDIDQLLKRAEKQGFTKRCVNGRWKVFSPDGTKKTFAPVSASDWRALPAVRKKLRSIGADV